jgi:hypothetical protein
MDAVLSGLVNLGVGGVMAAALVWFLYFIVTKTLPEMTARFGQELREKRETYLTEMREERAAFTAELRAERELRTRAVAEIVTAIGELQKGMAAEHNAMMHQAAELNNRLLDRIGEGFEQLVQEATENRTIMQGLAREPRRKVTRKHEKSGAADEGATKLS